ncbi:phosphate system positive regulatory protein pho81 [Zygosaccharomyces mellis]|uniref:Phosphate system positive regulatory protein pho81 n=1 Tax=Zygosaccharomyces mellis TaxID=42258 RepID=A0A4C2E3D4_9SACH|nr:phosphate system positive regulatory protein pho81 [Zygosaccharomyces mellis]
MKFGKYLEARQLELPEYSSHFIDYKGLKKLIKHLAVPLAQAQSDQDQLTLDDVDESIIFQRLQEHKASFFFKLERELEKVNFFYLEKESNLKLKFDILQSKYKAYRSRGKLSSKEAVSYKNIHGGLKKFQRDLANLEFYIELNRTGFSKLLKKWDKRSHSHQREFYLATVVSVQPVFTHNEVSRLNDATLSVLVKLDDTTYEESTSFYSEGSAADSQLNLIEANVLPSRVPSSLAPRDAVKITGLDAVSSRIVDIDAEIENWYMEIVNISRLKDTQRKLDMLKEFHVNKIEKFLDEIIPSSRIDKNLIFKDCFTKLFLLLVGSSMDDVSLRVFFTRAKAYIDLSYCDEDDQVFSRRNVFHEAANCMKHSRIFVFGEAFAVTSQTVPWALTKETLGRLLNAKDLHQRTPLHYAAELGKFDVVKLLIDSKTLDTVDNLDDDSKTPLVLAIIANHIDVVEKLLVDGNASPSPKIDESTKPQFAPLIVACRYNNYMAAKLLLDIGALDLSNMTDPEGLGVLHVVAKEGGDAQLIQLLVHSGADPNGVDSFNQWTPIFYAVQEGHAETVNELLNHGARMDITDEKNLGVTYYAIWEGHLDVLNVLLKRVDEQYETKEKKVAVLQSNTPFTSPMSPSNSLHDIPDFTLPPPIIPLRKYGHNFLEKKIFVKLMIRSGSTAIDFNKGEEVILSSPGRITLTSNQPDIIPRNIILPLVEEDDGEVVFQVDSLEDFSIDFEVFPAFGTRIIAKTTAMSSVFKHRLANGAANISLPLFDSRLINVGTLTFDYQIIFPYSGKPLEITKYDTYWKSSGGSDADTGRDGHRVVTSSSLNGSFVNVTVCTLNDGTIIVAPNTFFEVKTAKLFFNDLTRGQLEKICDYRLDEMPLINSPEDLKHILSSRIVLFSEFLDKVPPSIQLEIQVSFPTNLEIEDIPVKVSPFVDLDGVIDQVLLLVFEHVRYLRHSGQNIRSIVFSSCNWQACSILNWKQPNFPVLFHIKGLKRSDGLFVRDTPHNLRDLAVDPTKINFVEDRSRGIHQIVSFAANNNLLGIIVPYDLLKICRLLIGAIQGQGLLLVGSIEGSQQDALDDDEINGVHTKHELVFNKSIDM